MSSDASKVTCPPADAEAGAAAVGVSCGIAAASGGCTACVTAGDGVELLVADTRCTAGSEKIFCQAHAPTITTPIPTNAKPATKRQSRFRAGSSATGGRQAAGGLGAAGCAGALRSLDVATAAEGCGRCTVSDTVAAATGFGCRRHAGAGAPGDSGRMGKRLRRRLPAQYRAALREPRGAPPSPKSLPAGGWSAHKNLRPPLEACERCPQWKSISSASPRSTRIDPQARAPRG